MRDNFYYKLDIMRKLTGKAGRDTELRLNEWEFLSDLFGQFAFWYEQTRSAGIIEPNAMTFATSNLDGQESDQNSCAACIFLQGVTESVIKVVSSSLSKNAGWKIERMFP